MEKVVLGLSGGVDSAVAAALLRQQGYDVYGLFLELGLGGQQQAQQTADALGIPLHIAHRAPALEQHVCQYFASEYQNARTPNPCVVCNRLVKFQTLADYADEIGAKWLATGHYARIGQDTEGRVLLMRAQSEKDQSYMLHRLSREVLSRCIFPLGMMEDKSAVRAQAQALGLPVAQKKDSMDVCFIPDGNWQGWLERHGVRLPEGNFIDENGKILGRHKGLHHYTVGQRKGLGIAAEGRLFVKALRPETNEVVLSLNDVFQKEILVQQVHYCAPEYAADGTFACTVRVRYSKRAQRAVVTPCGQEARIVFEDEARAPAAGQAAVFYDGDIVIGGGFIASPGVG